MGIATTGGQTGRGLTHRDLDDTPDDGNRWELVDGELHVTPQPTPAHQTAIMHLSAALYAHVRAHSLGRVFPAAMQVVLDEASGVGPDLVFISNARLPGLQADGFYGARAGVPHYWIIDPTLRTLEVYQLAGDRYPLPLELRNDDIFRPTFFPGLEIELRDMWL